MINSQVTTKLHLPQQPKTHYGELADGPGGRGSRPRAAARRRRRPGRRAELRLPAKLLLQQVKFGFCGQTTEYCGDGCRSGPCIRGGGGASVADVVTDAFFNGIKNQAGGGCEGRSFYTRGAFLTAVNSYSGFARGGSEVEGKREIAAFFAHVTHETGHFCFISEINKNDAYCDRDPRYSQWPCAEGKKYYGRGPLQLSWNYNYGAAGRDNNFDGLGNPDVVAQDPVIAFRAALWFWMNNVHGVMPQGFGATTRAINGNLECDGKNTDRMNARVGYYRQYCQQLGVDPGGSLTC